MTPEDVAAHLAALPGCKQKGTRTAPAWYVGNRIVARLVAADELRIRCRLADRERLVSEHPETFGVPPRYEKHWKVQALLAGDGDAIRAALTRAWELQR
jgi:hypothetical protein